MPELRVPQKDGEITVTPFHQKARTYKVKAHMVSVPADELAEFQFAMPEAKEAGSTGSEAAGSPGKE